MNSIFPKIIEELPEADLPFEKAKAFISQSKDHQILFMEFDKDIDLPEHSHEAQAGFVLKGKIEMVINGEKKIYSPGDIYYIPAGVVHSGKIFAGYADITFFNEPARYKIKS